MTDGEDWGEGYVTGVEYVHSFHPALVPLNLAFATLIAGVRPPDVDRPFACLDLGCGNGFTPALIAAANPLADVWANDFLPAHIRNARATAAAGQVDNVTFVEASFADLPDHAPPQFDFVVAHGIWSWVSQANRERIVALLDRYVKPGGLVMVSYNCHSGWDSLLPLRRLLFAAGGRDGTPIERIERALAVARRLCNAGADYFRNTPAAVAALDQLDRTDRAYLAHEYLNEEWTLFAPSEVAAALAPAGLSYVGQGRIIDNVDAFWLTAAQRDLVDSAADASEDMRDLILDRRFRHDLFVRGASAASDADRAVWFARSRFALARPRAACTINPRFRAGTIGLPSALLDTVLDALAEGPATADALAARADLADHAPATLHEALGVLVAIGNVAPALASAGESARRDATDRFNAAALTAARMGESMATLASPVTGSGVAVSAAEQLLLDAWRIGIPLEAISIDGDEGAAERFCDATLPMLATLGIV